MSKINPASSGYAPSPNYLLSQRAVKLSPTAESDHCFHELYNALAAEPDNPVSANYKPRLTDQRAHTAESQDIPIKPTVDQSRLSEPPLVQHELSESDGATLLTNGDEYNADSYSIPARPLVSLPISPLSYTKTHRYSSLSLSSISS